MPNTSGSVNLASPSIGFRSMPYLEIVRNYENLIIDAFDSNTMGFADYIAHLFLHSPPRDFNRLPLEFPLYYSSRLSIFLETRRHSNGALEVTGCNVPTNPFANTSYSYVVFLPPSHPDYRVTRAPVAPGYVLVNTLDGVDVEYPYQRDTTLRLESSSFQPRRVGTVRTPTTDRSNRFVETFLSIPTSESPFERVETSERIERTINDNLEVKLRDLRVRYRGCLGHYPNKSNIFICHDFLSKSNSIYIVLYKLNTKGQVESKDELFDPTVHLFTLPYLGLINVDNTALLLQRRHRKSGESRYRRGFMFCNINQTYLSARELALIKQTKSKIYQESSSVYLEGVGEKTVEAYNQAFNIYSILINDRSYPEFKFALECLQKFRLLSVAISSKYSLKLCNKHNVFLLMRGDYALGAFNSTDGKIYVITTMFDDELKELKVPFVSKWGVEI